MAAKNKLTRLFAVLLSLVFAQAAFSQNNAGPGDISLNISPLSATTEVLVFSDLSNNVAFVVTLHNNTALLFDNIRVEYNITSPVFPNFSLFVDPEGGKTDPFDMQGGETITMTNKEMVDEDLSFFNASGQAIAFRSEVESEDVLINGRLPAGQYTITVNLFQIGNLLETRQAFINITYPSNFQLITPFDQAQIPANTTIDFNWASNAGRMRLEIAEVQPGQSPEEALTLDSRLLRARFENQEQNLSLSPGGPSGPSILINNLIFEPFLKPGRYAARLTALLRNDLSSSFVPVEGDIITFTVSGGLTGESLAYTQQLFNLLESLIPGVDWSQFDGFEINQDGVMISGQPATMEEVMALINELIGSGPDAYLVEIE